VGTIIQVKDLSKIYYSGDIETIALNNVTFEINKGEFVAIMGPSGSGKSTLMHILGFLDTPSSGEYVFEGKNVEEFSKYLDIPIINGLTDLSHPCQIMSDVMTFEELKGPIKNKKIAYIGDGNNVVYSLIEASVQFDFELCIACPKSCEPNKNILKWAKKNNANISVIKDPLKAANSADCVMTDKWISMSDKINKKKKKKILKPYQINKKIMKQANKDAIFMHCLPASRGEEVINEVIDGKQSVVWVEALNRIHIQKSIIEWCLK